MNHALGTDNRGMTLIEIIIATGMTTALALGAAYVMAQLQRSSKATTLRASAQEIRREISSMLEQDSAWFVTFNAPGNKTFTCLKNHRDCREQLPPSPEAAGLPFTIFDSAGSVYFDGLAAGSGYTLGGAKCTGFPGPGCPLRVETGWHPLCAPQGQCIPQQIELTAHVVYDPGPQGKSEGIAFNSSNYSLRMTKNLLSSNLVPPAVPAGEILAPPVPQLVQAPPVAPPVPQPHPVAVQAPQPATTGDAFEDLQKAQKRVVCEQIAPSLRGQSPDAVKQAMRNMGYPDSMYQTLMDSIKECP